MGPRNMMQNLVLIFLLNIIPFSFTFPTIKSNASESEGGKTILRYGFHRTQQCLNFEKAFVCIQKCLDLGYDVAHANKECACTCFRNKDKAKYTEKKHDLKTKWRHGAPTTKHPAWIVPLLPKTQMLHGFDDESSDEHKGKNDEPNVEFKPLAGKNDRSSENGASNITSDTGDKEIADNQTPASDQALPKEGGAAEGGAAEGGAAGGAVEGGAAEGEAAEGVAAEGGAANGAAAEGAAAEGGTAEGGTAEGAAAEGGATEGGAAEGAAAEGGAAEGGAAEGGAAEGGAAEGGAAEGGAAEGAAAEGGAADGGAVEKK